MGIFGVGLLGPLAGALGLGFLPDIALRIPRWPIVLILVGAGLTVIYYFGPSERPRWRWARPGSAFAVLIMMLLSFLLSIFVEQDFFDVSWLTNGAMGLLLVLVLRMFLAGLVMLLGGEINATLDRPLDEEGLGRRRGPPRRRRAEVPPREDKGSLR